MEHARIFSASQLDALFLCPGRAVLTADAPRTSSVYADWGTACHLLAAQALTDGDHVYAEALAATPDNYSYIRLEDGQEIVIDAEMVEVAKVYTDYVRDVAGPDGAILVEQQVSFHEHLGLPDEHEAFGTADALIVRGSEAIVVDLKTGRGVEVGADTAQLKAYALGCLEVAETVADIERVRLVIVQPRAGGIKELDLWVDELKAWARDVATPACRKVLEAIEDFSVGHLNPGEKQCKFCAAKATCPALRNAVLEGPFGGTIDVQAATPEEFAALSDIEVQPQDQNAEWLSALLSKVDLIEDWCKAVREEAHRRLANGLPLPGYKLVAGKRGARAWTDAKVAEETLRKQFRLTIEQAYDLKLISPTSAEKLAKAGTIGPRQWATLQELVHQPDGKPHVAPDSDPRPALTTSASEFPLVN